GVCLNWGCIPTKSLLKSARVFDYLNHASDYGIIAGGEIKADFSAIVARSRNVAGGMSKGVQFLFRKNNITHIQGYGRVTGNNSVEVEDDEGKKTGYSAGNIIVATGARSKELPGLKQDGQTIIGYREAMTLAKQPASMVVVGSGAIGCEFADFYRTIGTDVTLVEFLPRIVPNEDEEVSKQLERAFKKRGIKVLTGSSVEAAQNSGDKCLVTVKTPKGTETIECDVVLSAVGVVPNITGIGLEQAGVKTENGKIVVDEFYRSSAKCIHAIGDVVHGPALAHVASAEGIVCAEKLAGLNPDPIDYKNIPACTYTNPEIASCGLTESAAKEAGYDIMVGKFPFTASGKANASGSRDGFVKLIFDSVYGEVLGAHMIGDGVTELISEIIVARKLETTAYELIKSMHPHPTMSEAIMEAAAIAMDEGIHL
ncbi:MAG TPA: dihydrolipoyl dehydrogenase, partial [Bacteroidales bacterium]|nr:dihydrolipoyl dehydrogenase [Bacteroidales bacterium]